MPVTATRILLFDIDGTLVNTQGAGRRALDRALLDRYGWEGASQAVSMAGMTDPQILAEIWSNQGQARPSPEEQQAFFALYAQHLSQELETGPEGSVFPGVADLLEHLASEPDVALGLLTGNVVAGAQLKLQRFDLWRHFDFGAYGADAEERPALLPVALDRVSNLLQTRPDPTQAVIIGDTPRDIGVGLAHGARTIGVATGPFSVEELHQAGADHAFDDLSNISAVSEALLSREDEANHTSKSSPCH